MKFKIHQMYTYIYIYMHGIHYTYKYKFMCIYTYIHQGSYFQDLIPSFNIPIRPQIVHHHQHRCRDMWHDCQSLTDHQFSAVEHLWWKGTMASRRKLHHWKWKIKWVVNSWPCSHPRNLAFWTQQWRCWILCPFQCDDFQVPVLIFRGVPLIRNETGLYPMEEEKTSSFCYKKLWDMICLFSGGCRFEIEVSWISTWHFQPP